MTQPATAAPRPDAPPPGVTLAILGISSLTVMANATIAPALPGLRDHFGDTPGIETLAGLVVTLPSLFVVLTAGLFGILADRFDKRPLVMLSMLIYALGGASGLLAQTMGWMLAGRVALGLGVAGTMTLAQAYVGTLWHGSARDRFAGHQVAAMNFGGIIFMTAGGVMASINWRLPFVIYAVAIPIGIFAWFMLSRVPGRYTAEPRAVDAPAEDERFPWGAFFFVGPFAAILMITFYALPTRLPFLLAERGIGGPILTGLVLSTVTLMSIPGALLYGRIRRFVSPRSVVAFGMLTLGAGLLVISRAHSLPVTILGVALCGAPLGVMFPNFIALFMALVPPSMRGRASGLLTTAIFGGQFLSPLVSGPLVAAFGLSGGLMAVAVLPICAGLVAGLSSLREGRRSAAA
ncbi:MFS transporter [Pseudooceanicola nanhaiensis]|jgi:MFS family permease|uniref:MFS transporter n=1 Tax=Pseudooceanicola nanhaiensis TaxID=375761 RepID=A0A917SNB2_9RHOB|nr:MFS transporter [Pseudooceanicola nanhaiensis]GGL88785.1 MFS transporter [Pseudooceanicola nanhaiensis]